MEQNTNLVITAVGPDRSGIVDKISEFVLSYNCNIEDSRMAVLGGEFAFIMLINGGAEAVKKIRTDIPAFEKQANLTVFCKETLAYLADRKSLPYKITIVSLDHPGIVHSISSFLAEKKINIEAMETKTYDAPVTGAALFRIEATVAIPSNIPISQFNNELVKISERENFDIHFEALFPDKN